MKWLTVDTDKLTDKAKEAFANSLLEFGATSAKFGASALFEVPAGLFAKGLLAGKDVVSLV